MMRPLRALLAAVVAMLGAGGAAAQTLPRQHLPPPQVQAGQPVPPAQMRALRQERQREAQQERQQRRLANDLVRRRG